MRPLSKLLHFAIIELATSTNQMILQHDERRTLFVQSECNKGKPVGTDWCPKYQELAVSV